MTIKYCTEIPKHIDMALVGALCREWRVEFDSSLDGKAVASEARSRRYKAEVRMRALLTAMKVAEGDVIALHHDGQVTMVSVEPPKTSYGSKDVVFRHVKNMTQTDNKDADTEAGRIASEWLAAKRDEEDAEAKDSGLTTRLRAIEEKLLKHINSKLPHDWEESIFLTYLHADGWATWIGAYKNFGYGDWKIMMRFSTLVAGEGAR